jgi:hypothetical protein
MYIVAPINTAKVPTIRIVAKVRQLTVSLATLDSGSEDIVILAIVVPELKFRNV